MEKDLEYYKKLTYDIILKKKGDQFVLIIPELCCIEENATLEKAYEKLELEKEKYFKEIIEIGSQAYIREPGAIKHKKSNLFNSLLPFMIKLVIIIVVGVVMMQVAAAKLKSSERKISKKAQNVITDINNKLKKMPPEKKEEIRKELREIVHNVKPFVDEIKKLLDSEENNYESKRKP
mgnify:CR=1 FL=1